jgi:hypothetical protein
MRQGKAIGRSNHLLALAIGGLLFFIIVFVVCLAFIDYLESAHEKTVTHGPRRVP